MPAKAGIQNYLKTLDSRLRGDDVKGRIKNFYETIKFGICTIKNRGILSSIVLWKLSIWTICRLSYVCYYVSAVLGDHKKP